MAVYSVVLIILFLGTKFNQPIFKYRLAHAEGTSKVSCKCDFSKFSYYNGGLREIIFFP